MNLIISPIIRNNFTFAMHFAYDAQEKAEQKCLVHFNETIQMKYVPCANNAILCIKTLGGKESNGHS